MMKVFRLINMMMKKKKICKMKTLSIAETPNTPTVRFDGKTGVLEIKGRSITENALEFYRVLVEWLNEYSKNPQTKTVLNIYLVYFNTSTSKFLLDVFKTLERIQKNGQEASVNWFYDEDDEDMMECGYDYDSIIKVPFKMIEVIS